MPLKHIEYPSPLQIKTKQSLMNEENNSIVLVSAFNEAIKGRDVSSH